MRRWVAILMMASVPAAYSTPPQETPEALLLGALQARYPEVTRWEIKPLSEIAIEVSAPLRVAHLGSRSALRVGSQSYWYAVAGLQPVVVARQRISAKDPLSVGDGKIVEKNVLALNCIPLSDPASLDGMRAKHRIAVDQAICGAAIEPCPAVARGEEIVVHYQGDRVALTAKAIAQTDGGMGDFILVRNARDPKPFGARVSGPHEVTIHE